jgi:hypothetical protein
MSFQAGGAVTGDGLPLEQWLDRSRPLIAVLLVIAPVYLLACLYYFGSPQTTDVGYQPRQPVAYSHKLHAGELGIDCRYCHNSVEVAATAAIPSTSTCLNCHKNIAAGSPKLLPVNQSAGTEKPIPWVRVHDLPDYVYFDHSAHVLRGVSCVSCHGRVDTMEEVRQVETLSMGWCLDCHRAPEARLRPQEFITDLGWIPEEEQRIVGARVRKENNINPSTDCSTCHR